MLVLKGGTHCIVPEGGVPMFLSALAPGALVV